jgi:hypothetical protein
VDYETCAGRRGLELDANFDHAVAALWPRLDASEAPVAAAYCEVALTRARVNEVTGTLAGYRQGG